MKRFELHTSSWHYKLYRYLRNFYKAGPLSTQIIPFYKTGVGEKNYRRSYKPKSLCSYFWAYLGMVLGLPFLTVLLLLAIIIIAVIFVVVAPFYYPITHFKNRRAERREALGLPAKVEKEKQPSVVVEFAKAYKKRHCPLVELVED